MLTLADAAKAISAVRATAHEKQLSISVCVVDTDGELIALEKMDGASRISMQLCQNKALTSAIFAMPTDQIAPLAQPGQPLYGILQLQNGRFTFFGGGAPITQQDRVVGAVGVGGAEPADDVALAALGALSASESLTH
jgi:uncharacterized protein GlcG (DUF336 family)